MKFFSKYFRKEKLPFTIATIYSVIFYLIFFFREPLHIDFFKKVYPFRFYSLTGIGFIAVLSIPALIYLAFLKDEKKKEEFFDLFFWNFIGYNFIFNVSGLIIAIIPSAIVSIILYMNGMQ